MDRLNDTIITVDERHTMMFISERVRVQDDLAHIEATVNAMRLQLNLLSAYGWEGPPLPRTRPVNVNGSGMGMSESPPSIPNTADSTEDSDDANIITLRPARKLPSGV